MNKYLIPKLIICLLICFMSQVKSEKKSNNDGCIWQSDLIDEAIIKIKYITPRGMPKQAELFFDGNFISKIEMIESQGYGSKWWKFKREDKNFNPQSKQILTFFGNETARGFFPKKDEINTTYRRRVIFVGMDSTLYYFGYRNNPRLVRAGSGFWTLSNGCEFPGVLFNKRHLDF